MTEEEIDALGYEVERVMLIEWHDDACACPEFDIDKPFDYSYESRDFSKGCVSFDHIADFNPWSTLEALAKTRWWDSFVAQVEAGHRYKWADGKELARKAEK